MNAIFISYRRSDSAYVADRIYDHLASRFGRTCVFKDVDSIGLGQDFRLKIAEAVQACSVLVAVIGDEWISATDKDGRRRLDDPDDFVRIEVEAALDRSIPVIPVLIHGTRMPSAEDLPPSMEAFSFRNATELRPDPDFDEGIKRMSNAIADILGLPIEDALDTGIGKVEPTITEGIAAVTSSNRANITGDVIGSAIGKDSSVNARDITVFKQTMDTSTGLDAELKEALTQARDEIDAIDIPQDDKNDVTDDLVKLTEELAKPEPEPRRVTRFLKRIEAIAPTAALLLRSASRIVQAERDAT